MQDLITRANTANKEYRNLALRSEPDGKDDPRLAVNPRLFREVLLIAIATGDLVDALKRHVIYGKPLDQQLFHSLTQVLLNKTLDLNNTLDVGVGIESKLHINPRIAHAAIGLYGESAELLDAVLKQLDGDPLNITNLEEEDGDISWYKVLLGDEIDILNPESSAGVRLMMNIAKLQKRYPEKFSLAACEARDTSAEYAEMEQARAKLAA